VSDVTTNVETTQAPRRASTVRVPRSRGAFSGFLLILLGIWGAGIPFVGPAFHFAYTPNSTWTWTTGRLWLEVVPGAVTFLGGCMLLSSANRAVAVFGGWLATAAGGWFVVGPLLSTLWSGSLGTLGTPVGSHTRQVWEQIGFFYGLGAVIVLFAAHASGRLSVRSVRDVQAADRRYAAAAESTDGEPVPAAYPSTAADDETTTDGQTADARPTTHRA
jgi:hypothetical protein